MRLLDFSFLTDENVHPAVVAELRAMGCDVLDVCERELRGSEDASIMRLAHSASRVVVTHDKDFGALSIARRDPLVGILFLRPGHINPHFTIQTLQSLFAADLQLLPPFIVVARRINDVVRIRVRKL